MVVVALLLCQARHTDTEHGPELSIKRGTELLSRFRVCLEFSEIGFYFLLGGCECRNHHLHDLNLI